MAGGEALRAPEPSTAVSGEAFQDSGDSARPDVAGGDLDAPITKPPRRCLVCRQPLPKGGKKLHAGACAHERKITLQRLRRGRRRRW